MFHSLKIKLTLAFGSLMVVLFVAMGSFLVAEKSRELAADISQSTRSFAQFTVETVMELYVQYLEPGSFVPFIRDVETLLRQNSEISNLSIVSRGGEILFDSEEEPTSRYTGPVRTVEDEIALDRVQSTRMSLLLDSGRVLYVDIKEDRTLSYVDFNERSVDPPTDEDRIVDIVVPFDNTHAVIYDVNYNSLEASLRDSRMQIILFALAGLVLTLALSFLVASNVIRPLNALKLGALKLAAGDFNAQVRVKSKDEVGVLAETFNKMAKDLAKSTKAMLYQERVQKELELAKQIQNDLLPKEKLVLKKMDVAGGVVPATEIGGDAFDYIQMEDGRYLTYLGDVTGHGVPAGIVAALTNALLYSYRGEKKIAKVLSNLNAVIREKTTSKLFMTMGILLVSESKSAVTYVNAGHPPVLYYNAKQKKVFELNLKSIALGLTEDLKKPILEKKINLSANDVLVIYSDGIPEAKNPKKEIYGLERLKKLILSAAKDLYTAEGIKNAVLSDAAQFIGKGVQEDDMTVVVVKRKK